MNATTVPFRVRYDLYDHLVAESVHPIICPDPVRVVGAARSANQYILLPLREVPDKETYPGDMRPRSVRLFIPPRPSIVSFNLPSDTTIVGTETADQIMAFLNDMGVEAAFLHVRSDGLPDTDHEGARTIDKWTGRYFFRPLERVSPVVDRRGMEAMLGEAKNFLTCADINEADMEWKPVPLRAATLRAFAAALEGASTLIQENMARNHEGRNP